MNTLKKHEFLLIPAAVIIGSIIVAASVCAGANKLASISSANKAAAAGSAPAAAAGGQPQIRPVTSADHIYGNPNAKAFIVEYSDTECPFCKRLQSTLGQIMDAHSSTGDVAWVFRYFPVHQRSENEANAQECAAQLGGNMAFWKFTDEVFKETNSNDSLDPAALPRIAKSIGLDVNAFNACVSSGKYNSKIEADRAEAIAQGAHGTPWSVIVANGKQTAVSGALPYDAFDSALKTALGGQ